MKLPHWARKPYSKKDVVATPRGWMVKETGEYLKLVKNLDERLKELKVELDESLETIPEDDNSKDDNTTVQEEKVSEKEPEEDTTTEKEPEAEEEKPKPKRGGRPRKQTSTK